nr:RNA-directed DNA polymerase, eukaryota [Tanacetum cinerariifolium]
MGHRRSNDDGVHKISTSIYVTNFLDLYFLLKTYGKFVISMDPSLILSFQIGDRNQRHVMNKSNDQFTNKGDKKAAPKVLNKDSVTLTNDDKTTSEVKKTSHSGKSMEDKEESMCSGHFRKPKIPRSGGSILQLMEEVVKVGQIMGYNMEGCSKNIEEIIGANAFNSFISEAGLEEGPLEKIREWVKVKKDSSNNYKKMLKADLVEIDIVLEKGEGDSDILNKRSTIFKALQDIDKLESMEVAQKAKIKWAIEGDENLKYYHGILNKKRSQLAIRGILVDGTWIDSSTLVKKEFQFHRGLKQGDPLSPFLFILIIESLHISVQRVVDA